MFNGTRSNANWIGQNILALDFDGGITPEEAIKRMQAYEITPNAWYPTFSDTPAKRKFRLLFVLDTFITDIEARSYLMDGLIAMYPEADKACKNPAHIFYGTNKKGQVLNSKAISMDLFHTVLDSDKLKNGGRPRKINTKHPGVKFLRKDGFSRSSYSNTIEATSKTTHQLKEEYFDKLLRNKNSKAIDWDKLQSRVKIFYDFMNSEERLSYEQLVGLAQNLVWLKGGQQLYEERLEAFNKTHTGDNPYPDDGRFGLVKDFLRYNKDLETAYYPQRLDTFSPYTSDHRYRNLITAERDLLDGIEQIEPIQRMSLRHAQDYFNYEFDQVMDELDNDIVIFKLPTGFGKTRRIKNLDEVTLAFPTNKLKREVYDDREDTRTAIITPEFPVFNDAQLNLNFSRLYSAGFTKQVHKILHELTKGFGCSPEDQAIAQAYVNQNRAAQESVKSIFTTHSRAIHTSFSHDTIIFDEDPLPLILDVDTLKIADLKRIKKKSRSRLFGRYTTQLIELQRFLELVEEGEILTLPEEFNIDISNEWMLFMQTEGIETNIMKFLNCAYFYKDENDRDLIHFIRKEELPTDKKIIIMSATIPVEIYKELYGERVRVIDISDVTHTGTITQHVRYSYSRNSLAQRLDQIKEKLPDRPTITFKSFHEQIEGASSDMWFGNCSGYNQYTGTSINVLGTPHKNNAQYLLIGKVLGYNVDQFNREFRMQIVI